MAKAQWVGHGYRRPTIGRGRIMKGVKPYGGRWVDIVQASGDLIIAYIYPSERVYLRREFDKLKLNEDTEDTNEQVED